MYSVENYVEILENKSKQYALNEIVTVGKRVNNTKRDFLFINPLQGKHIPVSPIKTKTLVQELAQEVLHTIKPTEKVVIIGFAETATALGRFLAQSMPNCSYRTQTTREALPNEVPCIQFNEEHSHAVEQMLYADVEKLNDADRIIFVEDEISTGKTILNFIDAIQDKVSNVQFAVTSILNWQSPTHAKMFEDRGIATFYLVRGYLKDQMTKVDVPHASMAQLYRTTGYTYTQYQVLNESTYFEKERLGSDNIRLNHNVTHDMYRDILKDCNKVLVLGTEEYMYAALEVGSYLESIFGVDVSCHATTRSPIVISNSNGYGIKNGFQVESVYDSERVTYLYNLSAAYDKIIIVTDKIVSEYTLDSYMGAFNQVGYDKDICVVTYLKGEKGCNSYKQVIV